MKKHFKSLSASTFQMVVNQVFGLLFFLGMAALIPKALFGQVNWAVAVCSTLTIIGSMGFDHVIVRKLSAGALLKDTVGIYIAHTYLFVVLSLLALGAFSALDGGFFSQNPGFTAIFIGLLATFLSMPYKQMANGRERFWHLAFMGISGNVFRVAILAVFYFLGRLDAFAVSMVFLAGGLLEWMLCLLLSRHMNRRFLSPTLTGLPYANLIREALPQMGVILLDSAFARIDWILMGLLSTDSYTADYSFSYKAYESSRLPLLVIAPIILPKISRLYSKGGIGNSAASQLNLLWKMESLICVFIPFILNVVWVDAVDLATKGRYGHPTQWVYAVLSLTLPMVYMLNYLWTLAFAQGRLRMILRFTIATLVCNLVCNLLLIPKLGALGAAIAFTVSTALQLTLYKSQVREPLLRMPLKDFVISTLAMTGVFLALEQFEIHWLLKLALAMPSYLILAWAYGARKWIKHYLRGND